MLKKGDDYRKTGGSRSGLNARINVPVDIWATRSASISWTAPWRQLPRNTSPDTVDRDNAIDPAHGVTKPPGCRHIIGQLRLDCDLFKARHLTVDFFARLEYFVPATRWGKGQVQLLRPAPPAQIRQSDAEFKRDPRRRLRAPQPEVGCRLNNK